MKRGEGGIWLEEMLTVSCCPNGFAVRLGLRENKVHLGTTQTCAMYQALPGQCNFVLGEGRAGMPEEQVVNVHIASD